MHPFAEGPVKFTVPLKPQSVTEKQSVTLECEVSKPNKKVSWHKAGKEIKPGKDVEITVEGTVHRLTIKSVKKEDAVEFTAKLPSDKTSAKLTIAGISVIRTTSNRIFVFSVKASPSICLLTLKHAKVIIFVYFFIPRSCVV